MRRFIVELRRRNVIRVGIFYLPAAWGIVQVVDILGPAFGWPDSLVRITTICLALLFPVALVLSWLYEITSEGLKLESDISQSGEDSIRTSKKLDRMIMLALLAAVVIMGIDKFVLEPGRDLQRDRQIAREARTSSVLESLGPHSIAVLPFVNMSADQDTDYFSDGVSEEILNALAKTRTIRVISRSSSWKFKKTKHDIPAIAKQLNVDHVLEGSVRLSGNRVRVIAQLIDATTDIHIWSESYDRDLKDIFDVQDEIAIAIVSAVTVELDDAPTEKTPTPRPTSITAYQAFLRGRHFITQRTPEMVAQGVAEFQKALELDPEYAAAHAELAVGIRLQSLDTYGSNYTSEKAFELAWPHANAAVALAPDLAESHAAVGFLNWHAYRLDVAEAHFREAIRLNPSYMMASNWLSILLADGLGRRREAFDLRKSNTELDPLSPVYKYNYIVALVNRHRFAEARAELQLLQPLSDNFYVRALARLDSAAATWADGAMAELRAIHGSSSGEFMRGRLSYRLFALGLPHEARNVLTDPPIELALLDGRYDQAIELAEQAAKDDDSFELDLITGFALANKRDYGRALPYLESAWQRNKPQLFPRAPSGLLMAATLVKTRRELNQELDADGLLATMRYHIEQYRDAGIVGAAPIYSVDYLEGLVALVAGERERAIVLLENAIQNGVYVPFDFDVFEQLRSHPDFERLRAIQKRNQIRERNRLLSMVCTDHPLADRWSPEPATCAVQR